ncbi:pelota family protein [Picrophilus oshimae]|uniref:Protein pelota homolog n=1 Tax=Picrophilus torridus (strain ATCC 700027 / DSM 9790 / JCM 10055 / NBRC 100828 / KAW 2/3) TaxID=1122961 RepID=PELO_PICTO|nr:pelota family protein [Picrophilus oshimae]Q6L2M8.1 RecName: Full=Protein pelota homolog [Picrophilus oshimae DSM 9789]AAT42774.1 predicted RNA-binding protein [Picrophilus oshimae DSM 9789]
MKINIDEKLETTEILIETQDDLWYIKNILNPGDIIEGIAYRRLEKRNDLERSKSTERIPIKVKIKIENLDFQPFTDKIKILGIIIDGDFSGEHQSIMYGPGDTLKIYKNLNEAERDFLNEAVKNEYSSGMIFVSLDEEAADIYLMRSYSLQDMAHIESNKTGKRYDLKYNEKQYFLDIIKALKNIKNVFLLIVLGTGFEPEKLYNEIKKDPFFNNIDVKFYNTYDTGKSGVYNLLNSDATSNIIKESRMAKEKRILETFLRNLNSGLSVYGYDEINNYLDNGAIDTLIISEEKFKMPETRELLNKASGIKIYIISNYTEPGEIIRSFGGYCAILRYKIK